MRLDENGESCPETLGEYYDLTHALFGEDLGEKALAYLEEKIRAADNGRDEKVIAPDDQIRAVIFMMIRRA